MADLFSLLVQSGNSLGAHSAALATAGHNIANANTPGYTRQVVNLEARGAVGSLGAGAVGTGVWVAGITAARDQFVERQIPNALAAQARSQAESNSLRGVTALNTDLEGGMTSSLAAFYSSLRTLAQDPGDVAARQGVIGGGQFLARAFNQTVGDIEAARNGLDAKVIGKVNEINAAARNLADINIQIQISKSSGAAANDLVDARVEAVGVLAALTGATPYTNSSGDVSMALPGGAALVLDGYAATLSTVSDASNGGHLALRLMRPDGSGPVTVDGMGLGGEMGGMFAARDGALRTAVQGLDTFAFDLANAINTVHQVGYAMDGTTGRTFFTIPVSASGAASQIAVNATVAADARLLGAATSLPAASGDNRNILALIATERQTLSGGSDPVATLQRVVTGFGISTSQADAMAAHDSAMASHITKLRDSGAGVSIDEEMINLTKAQRAYEAVSKVIATADQMLDTLMKLR